MGRARGGRGITVRHGTCLAHVSDVEEAAQLMGILGGLEPAPPSAGLRRDCAACTVLQDFDGVLREAGRLLGRRGKASSEDVRAGLRRAGHEELAKEWSAFRAGRRAVAHPPGEVLSRVLAALASG